MRSARLGWLAAAALGLMQAGMAADMHRSPQDRRFVVQACAMGESEIAAGRLAQRQAHASSAKSLANSLIDDPQQADRRLADIARKDGFGAELARARPQSLAKLKTLHGDSFDQAYASMMVGNHRDAITLFQLEAQSDNRDLKRFAAEMLPTLKSQLSLATNLMQAQGGF